MRITRLLLIMTALAASACGGGEDNESDGVPSANFLSLFEPAPLDPSASAVIPFPFDGLFSGFTDPTLNISNPSNASFVTDANRLDGFSTTATLFTDFLGFADIATAASSILVIDTSTGAPLTPGIDYTLGDYPAVDPSIGAPVNSVRTRILIHPLAPLKPETRYIVAVLDGLRDTAGNAVLPSAQFRVVRSGTPVSEQDDDYAQALTAQQAATLETLRSQLIRPVVEALIGALGIGEQNIIMAWSFTTQSIGKTLAYLDATATPGAIAAYPTGLTVQDLNPALPPVANVAVGALNLPYYLGAADGNIYSTAPLTRYWLADATRPDVEASFLGQVPCGAFAVGAPLPDGTATPSESTTTCFPVPVKQSDQMVPLLISVPNANSGQTRPEGGWPVVIFQHGITGNRSQMLAIAPALAAAGFVTVAMDLPLHGLTSDHPLAVPGTTERTFELDLVDNATSAPGPDGAADPSGTHFINLSSLITSRDNLRQAAADLIQLSTSLPNLDLDGDPESVDVDTRRIHFAGLSLGGIVGGTFAGSSDRIGAATLAVPGGGIAKLLDASVSFGPRIAAGLAASGVTEGTDTYETYLRFAQQIMDDGDPINYAVSATARHPLHMIEVIGDTVVPNSAPRTAATAANDLVTVEGLLSGTEPLYQQMGLAVYGADEPAVLLDPEGVRAVVRFDGGSHGSLLDPSSDAAITAEMQTETANFMASDGRCLPIGGSCQ